jgi:phosphoribosylformylglycinamidine synthase
LEQGVAVGAIRSAHDVSSGGLGVALAECAISGPAAMGAEIELPDALRPDALLFGESTGRVVTTTDDADALLGLAAEAGVPARRIGATGGTRLRVRSPGGEAWIDVSVERLRRIWRQAIPRRLAEPDAEEAA